MSTAFSQTPKEYVNIHTCFLRRDSELIASSRGTLPSLAFLAKAPVKRRKFAFALFLPQPGPKLPHDDHGPLAEFVSADRPVGARGRVCGYIIEPELDDPCRILLDRLGKLIGQEDYRVAYLVLDRAFNEGLEGIVDAPELFLELYKFRDGLFLRIERKLRKVHDRENTAHPRRRRPPSRCRPFSRPRT